MGIEKAKEYGADIITNPKECDPAAIKELTGGSGADVSFECIGNKGTGPLGIDVIRNTRLAIIVGIFEEPSAFNFFSLSGTDKRVMGTLAYTLNDFKGLAALMTKGIIRAKTLKTSISKYWHAPDLFTVKNSGHLSVTARPRRCL